MTYDVVSYSRNLDDAIVRLQSHLWGDDLRRNAAYLQWKYGDNPYLDEPLVELVRHGGEVVGMRGMCGALWEAGGGDRHLVPYADDFVIAPAHRNRGVAALIMAASLEAARRRGHRLVVSLSAGPVTFVGSLAAGWRSAGSYAPLVYRRSAGVGARARSIVGHAIYERAAALSRRAGVDAFSRLDRSGTTVRGVRVVRQPEPEAMADLVRRLPWDGRIRHVRDASYFAWRFRNPLHDYRFLYAGEGRLSGYLVLQRHRSRWADARRVNLADWEAADDAVRAALLDAALQEGRLARLHAWSSGVSPAVAELLASRGFVADAERARRSGLLLRRLDDGTADLRLATRDPFRIADWDLRMIYSMAA